MVAYETLELLITAIFTLSSVVLLIIDLKVRRLPNLIVLPTSILVMILIAIVEYFRGEFSQLKSTFGIPALITLAFLLISLFYPNGLGMGDIKVIFLIGIVLCNIDPMFYFFSLCNSFVGGAIFALASRIIGRKDYEFAFGPFLLLPAVGIALLKVMN